MDNREYRMDVAQELFSDSFRSLQADKLGETVLSLCSDNLGNEMVEEFAIIGEDE